MREFNYVELLPRRGVIAVLGKDVEEKIMRAAAYAREEGKKLKVVPLNPRQAELAQRLNIPTVHGYPDYFYVLLDFEPMENLFTVGNCDCPMLLRLYEMGAEKTVVLLRRKYHTVSVEYSTYLSHLIEPIISLYGEIVARRENPFGHRVVDIVPIEEDPEELRRLLKEVPGVVEVGILPIIPYRKIVLKSSR
ncbi:MAG: ribose-5-phosphate isomerase A [Candidatus Diapherotrites archaeon]|nr:ribose-5-phosphate isomerase A [Candidatus Diapherotrites archaeon]